jgi:hypothetical protein
LTDVVNLIDAPYQSRIIISKKTTNIADFTTTVAVYPETADMWILYIKETFVYPDILIDTYVTLMNENKERYAYGFFGYMFDPDLIENRSELIHVIDQTYSACYHRSFFTDKWAKYISTTEAILDVNVHMDVILSNWLAGKNIHRYIIDVPWCNASILEDLNPGYTPIEGSVLATCISTLAKNKLYFIKKPVEKEKEKAESLETVIKYYSIDRPIVAYEHMALLLESRFDPTYELLLRQVLRFLPTNFRIVLMITPASIQSWHQLIMHLTGGKIHPGLILLPLKQTLTCVQDYNKIMLNIDFWKQFSMYKKVLIFQTDTMMFKYGLEQYMKYDYIGAPWSTTFELAKGVGNGGFSLRTIQAMIKCLEKKNTIKILKYTNAERDLKAFNGLYPEDVFYSCGMLQLKLSVAPLSIASYFANECAFYNHDLIGCHQLQKLNKNLYDKHLLNSIIPYKHILHVDVGTHRYGWVNVKQTLDSLFTNPNGIELRSYGDVGECSFSEKAWVGIFHLTPLSTKKYYDVCDILNLRNRPSFVHNLQFCKGIFTLSNYITTIWKGIVSTLGLSIPVDTVYHPVGFDGEFDPAIIDKIQTAIMVGSQLRRPSTLYKLDLPTFRKVWLPGRTLEKALSLLQGECDEFSITLTEDEKKSVEILSLSNEDYDALINTSYLIVDQVNASANNAIIEAISRNIPIFCNRLPATEEYIGKDYPLFFRNVTHLQTLLQDKATIRKAYDYLKAHQELKDRLTMNTFVTGILNSPITKQILTQKVPSYLDAWNELTL